MINLYKYHFSVIDDKNRSSQN